MVDEFIFRVRVYYEDTDFSGVVYHARYLQFFERARTELLRAHGVTHTELLSRPEPLVFAVRRMQIDWRTPARIDDELDLRSRLVAALGARMEMRQSIWRGRDEVATAVVEAACINLAGRARRIPRDILDRLGSAA